MSLNDPTTQMSGCWSCRGAFDAVVNDTVVLPLTKAETVLFMVLLATLASNIYMSFMLRLLCFYVSVPKLTINTYLSRAETVFLDVSAPNLAIKDM